MQTDGEGPLDGQAVEIASTSTYSTQRQYLCAIRFLLNVHRARGRQKALHKQLERLGPYWFVGSKTGMKRNRC